MQERMSLKHAIAGIAQAAINIDAGLVEIQPGSYSHRAMHALCWYLSEEPEVVALEALQQLAERKAQRQEA